MNTVNTNPTIIYLSRTVDSRMVSIIEKTLLTYKVVLDLGCGSGLYGKFLKKNGSKVIGLDYNPVLCEECRKTGDYELIICDDVMALDDSLKKVDAIFCSEFLEHMNNKNLKRVLSKMEKVTESKIVITVPNPLSPHFKYDPAHILVYSIYSFLDILNNGVKFKYKMYPLGFSEKNLKRWHFRFLNVFASRMCLLSPTVLYVGTIRTERHK